MADDNKELLSSLINTRLPALPSEREEPREPSEPREDITPERGRTPDEVVQDREKPADTERQEPTEAEIPATRGSKKKPGEKTYAIRVTDENGKKVVKEFTAKQLEAAGLLEDLAITHGKHSSLQEKYNALAEKLGDKALEQVKGEKPVVEQPQAPQPQEITNAMIAQVYDPAADQILADLVKSNLLESDLLEAYPRGVKTLTGQIRWLADEVMTLKAENAEYKKFFEALAAQRNGQVVAGNYNKQLDDLVLSDPKLYAGLKDKKIRDAFTAFLVDEVKANIGQTTGEDAPKFLSKQWVAFNAQAIVDAAKSESERKRKSAFVYGDTGGARGGIPDTSEKTLMDRMIDNSGRIPSAP